ncbi:MAG: ISL3 family transposase [Burkholderiaceae bacterium]
MVKQEYIDKLVSIQGFSVGGLRFVESAGAQSLEIVLNRDKKKYSCGCGRVSRICHDRSLRRVRDLPFGPYFVTRLVFEQYRISCKKCGIVTETLDFVSPRVSYTKRLAASVALSCQEIRSIKAVAQQYHLHWETVKNIDKQALEERLPEEGDTDATLLAVDEFSIKKRHHYATTVANVQTSEVLFVGEGRDSETLAKFYLKMSTEQRERIQAVAMDMWPAFASATKAFCPNAEIVYDPFHIIQAFHRDVIDNVRVAEYKKAKKKEKDVIKGSRFILFKNQENLNDEKGEPFKLQRLLQLNKRLNTVYILRDDLKNLWQYKSQWAANNCFEQWYKRAIYSKIEPLKKFAKTLKNHLPGILAHCTYPIHTGFSEGINNKIKVIKRIAFGFRDYDYFFLKIRGAFHYYHT